MNTQFLLSVDWNSVRLDMYLFAGFFIVAGTSHFLIERFFLRIMPKWVPFPKFVNHASGLTEILLALFLFPDLTRIYAAWLLFALLLAVWPANFYHYFSRNKTDPPKWALLARLPMQIPLLYWAYSFTW